MGLSRRGRGRPPARTQHTSRRKPADARVCVRLFGADALRRATASSLARLSDSVVHSDAFDCAPLRRRRRGFSRHPGEGLGTERGLVTYARVGGVRARSRNGTAGFVAQRNTRANGDFVI